MDKMKILVPGAGPIIIGQAAEFDYSGSQCCSALREAGHKVVLVNSNPATIQTDPDTADIVYIEPLTVESVGKIIEKEKPDAIIPGMGGQTGLNLTVGLEEKGILKKHGVKILGTSLKSIEMAEDRDLFRKRMVEIGEPVAKSGIAKTIEDSLKLAKKLNYPVVVRPAFTLGGTGGGIAYDQEELEIISGRGLALSPAKQLLIEESILGWLEFEFEVLRDKDNNAIIVCSMENLDPMGVHTGESIVVAPSLTLPERAYQKLRTSALKVVKSLGIVGGCNVQFAYNSKTQDYILIEVNPRVSRSSALASKATGVPIARIASMLCLGHKLHELSNRVTGNTSAAFEPSIDYVVTKIPRWPFDKFKLADRELGTQMKSTGETMSIGRTFEESLMKAWRSIGQGEGYPEEPNWSERKLKKNLSTPNDRRLLAIWTYLLKEGATQKSIDKVCKITEFHAFFIERIASLVRLQIKVKECTKTVPDNLIIELKRNGFGDKHISHLTGISQDKIRKQRKGLGITSSFLMVDTCAGEFEAKTPYYYSTFENEIEVNGERFTENEVVVSDRKKVLVLGSGPNRIGQGIEFDYCCVHGVLAAKEMGYETIMINCNPETVSTDFDTADKLFFEPVFWEHIFDIIKKEKPQGVIVQLGGQTALKLAEKLHKYGVKILGTSFQALDLAEDRGRFSELLADNDIPYPEFGVVESAEEALVLAKDLCFPILVRPSYVLGGQGMKIVINEEDLQHHVVELLKGLPGNRILLDHYLDQAIEAEVDAISDGEDVYIIGMMEHIEPCGIHSGDSNSVLPPFDLSDDLKHQMAEITKKIALATKTVGLINIQFALKNEVAYVIEANPRASRTVPFIAKAYNEPYVKYATQVMLGKKKVSDFKFNPTKGGYAIKVPVFSFDKFSRNRA